MPALLIPSTICRRARIRSGPIARRYPALRCACMFPQLLQNPARHRSTLLKMLQHGFAHTFLSSAEQLQIQITFGQLSQRTTIAIIVRCDMHTAATHGGNFLRFDAVAAKPSRSLCHNMLAKVLVEGRCPFPALAAGPRCWSGQLLRTVTAESFLNGRALP